MGLLIFGFNRDEVEGKNLFLFGLCFVMLSFFGKIPNHAVIKTIICVRKLICEIPSQEPCGNEKIFPKGIKGFFIQVADLIF